MPGRVSARASRASAAGQDSQKSSTQTLRSTRTSVDHRASSSPVADIPDEGETTSLRKHVAAVFADSQKSTAGHRKLVINLRKIQEACCYEPTSKKGRQDDQFDEDDFNREIVRCVLRILSIRKSETVGDRVVRFLGVFLRVASDKDNQIASQDPDMSSLPETPTSRLSNAIFNTLLQVLGAKDKVIRFRAVQITSHMINTLDTLDDQLFHILRLALLKRIHDKEATVRMHAIYGLTRLAAEVDEEEAEDSDDSDSGAAGVLEKLLILLQNDPSAEVRRSLLLNLPLVPKTLPYLLERARDQDPATRRALFARLLPALGDFRHLSLTHREKLLRWGLRDRDEAVRKATARLFRERWIEDCAALPAARASGEDDEEDGEGKQKDPNRAADPSLDALLELLERIDVTNSAANGIAVEAMKEFWDGRPDYVSYITFKDAFWAELTPESVFVARTFNEFCRDTSKTKDARESSKLMDMLEQKMPEVTRFGFLLEMEIKKLVEVVKAAASGGPDGDGDEEAEEESVSREFVVEQMLTMAATFDYSDEVGRRKMFGLLRDAIAMPELPEEATRLVAEVLRLVCGDDSQGKGEREFCGVILEAIAEVHDTIMGDDEKKDEEDGDESFHSARSELSSGSGRTKKKPAKDADGDMSMDDEVDEDKAIREIMVNMKCLHIAQCMLQNVQCDLEENAHLVTMLNNLVVPAVRSQEAPIRERGLVCLGLCCLLGKNLAQENLSLFLHCFAKGHPELQTIALQIITDILTTHPSLLAPAPSASEIDATSASVAGQAVSPLLKPVLKAFSKALKSESPEVQSTGATALSKLMLSQLITDADILKQLVITFFDPETSANAGLRQALSYFLPVYCHSRYENAARMVQVSAGVINRLGTLREAFVEDEDAMEDEMVTTGFVGGLLVDWTDPRKIISPKEQGYLAGKEVEDKVEDGQASTHMLMAEAVLERMVTGQTSKDERKALFSMLNKLHLTSSNQNPELIRTVLELIAEATETRLATDATSRNVLTKLQTTLLKLIHDSAGAERGADETAVDVTALMATPGRRRTTTGRKGDDAAEEDEVTMQLQRELEATRIEEEDEGDESKLSALGEKEEVAEEYDTSQLPDESEMQSLVDSLEDDEDDEVL
ncbi:ARM repeat-containing protein [Myriangium duriaei CBS 260.36]|uniref:ARM repeat-containing protein n=1 Tax=Myriangium duriaei CBS 260.36 TaxID=1168546 RepID=A0A9P4J0E0_9PEZI|nr:ARM repeat-containing protein [Myriangium duriaei CBS 260.36]